MNPDFWKKLAELNQRVRGALVPDALEQVAQQKRMKEFGEMTGEQLQATRTQAKYAEQRRAQFPSPQNAMGARVPGAVSPEAERATQESMVNQALMALDLGTGGVKGAVRQKIKSAAFKLPDGTILTGKSHPEIMFNQIEKMPKELGNIVDGFITDAGKFVSRTKAWKIAEKAGQFTRDTKAEIRQRDASWLEGIELHSGDVQKRHAGGDPDAVAAVVKTGARAPNSALSDLSKQYVERFKIDSRVIPHPEKADPVKGKMMADTYDKLQSNPNDPEVRAAYKQFETEVKQQHDMLIDAGYKFDYSPHDPYPNSAAMLEDLRDRKTIKVFKTAEGQEHPLMTNEANDMFRAIHDAFGHGINGNQFGPRGEEGAFRDHSAMFSPQARRVMATETRGQNSWVNFGPKSNAAMKDRPYAEQKAALWPEHLMGDYKEMVPPRKVYTPEEKLARRAEKGARAAKATARANSVAGVLEKQQKTWQQYLKLGKQVGDEPALRRKQLADALRNPDMIEMRHAGGDPDWLSSWIAPAQRDIIRPGGNASKVDDVEEMAYKTFKSPKFLKWLAAGKGMGNWYDTRRTVGQAVDALGDKLGPESFNDLIDHVAASTAMSRPDNNLRRGSWWRALKLQGLIDPATLRTHTMAAPKGMGHIAQTAHHFATADLLEKGGLNVMKNPKPGSFAQNLQMNHKPYTNDTRMATATLEVQPKLSMGLAGKPGDATPRLWAYAPMERGAQRAASELQGRGLLDETPDGVDPTATFQAQVWGGIGAEGGTMGLKPSQFEGTFSDIVDKLIARSAKLWDVSQAEATKLFWKGQPLDLPLGAELLTGKARKR